jgi:hypothetical protein
MPLVAIPLLLAALLPLLMLEPALCEVTISVTPTRIPLSLAPEDTQTAEVTLINQGTEDIVLKPKVLALQESTDEGLVLKATEECSWFSPQADSLLLKQAESGSMALTAKVPSGTDPGSYSFALTFEMSGEGGEGMVVTGGVAVLLELEVLPGGNGGGGASSFPTALVVTIIVLAVLLLGMCVFLFFLRRKRASGPDNIEAEEVAGQ